MVFDMPYQIVGSVSAIFALAVLGSIVIVIDSSFDEPFEKDSSNENLNLIQQQEQ